MKDAYRIRLKGHITPSIADWLGKVEFHDQGESGTELIAQFSDQPALRGFLELLWDLNISVISVEKINCDENHDMGHEHT